MAKGASVDAVTGDYDHTVMHRAAAYNALRVIKYLHSQGAKLDTPDASKEKLTPLQTAKKIALSADAAALIEALVEGRNVDGMFGGDADDSDGDDSDGGEGAAAAKPKAEAAWPPRRRRRARRRRPSMRRPPPPPRATGAAPADGRQRRRWSRRRRRRGAGCAHGMARNYGWVYSGSSRANWSIAMSQLTCACTSVYTRNS